MTDKTSRARMLREIKEIDFVLQELNLFLDTHSHHNQALEMFQRFEAKSKQLRHEYEKMFGPLTPSTNDNTQTWEWIKGPWPWENC